MDIIDTSTLKMVGQVVLEVVFQARCSAVVISFIPPPISYSPTAPSPTLTDKSLLQEKERRGWFGFGVWGLGFRLAFLPLYLLFHNAECDLYFVL